MKTEHLVSLLQTEFLSFENDQSRISLQEEEEWPKLDMDHSVIPADDPGIKKDLTDYLFSQLS